jgi:uncharacterized protein (TIGR00252 family)
VSTQVGRSAENVAAVFLQRQGLAILAQNWRTRWCEIDIVANGRGKIYFVEVKYRSSQQWGSGFDYITPRKLLQMRFAAEFWQAAHKTSADYFLSAIELSGDPPEVLDWVEDI